MNPLFLIDFYKVGHVAQYPKGIRRVWTNWTPRYSRRPERQGAIHFGLQYFMERYLNQEFRQFFATPFTHFREEYSEVIRQTLGIADPPTEHLRQLHTYGRLPINIYSVPEGTFVPCGVPAMLVVNTDPQFFWLPNYLETLLSNILWQPSTTATTASIYREIFERYAREWGESDMGFVDWMGHDFSMRGTTGIEAAMTSGMGHLLYFSGTDTVPAILGAQQYYRSPLNVGGSVPATEHSVMCAGSCEGEFETFKRLITEVYPTGIVSIVSDTWDLWKVLTDFLPRLKETILARDGKIVIRPDCYDPETEVLTKHGFTKFSALGDDDEVCQYNEDGTTEFVKPTRIINQSYVGPMVKFSNTAGHVDLLVTPNHRMIRRMNYNARKRHTTHGEVTCKTAESAKYSCITQHLHGGGLVNDNERVLSSIERIWIAFQADGAFQTKMTHRHIRFNFTKRRKVERMRALLIESGFEYKESVEPARPNNTQFYVHLPSDAPKTLDWVNFGEINGEWARQFIEELSHWDATRRSGRRFKFDTTIPINAEVVQTVAALAGYRTKYTISEDNRDEIFSDVYTVHICLWDHTDGQSIQKEVIENYGGTVHCVTVPSGMLLVRRNKCVSVSGNSGDPVKILTGNPESTHGPERAGVLRLLADCMGTNNAGHILKAGAIYGDSITPERAEAICRKTVREVKLSPFNVVYGIGSFTYQYVTRDTYGFAMKATAIENESGIVGIFKDPVTDDGNKRSHRGIPYACYTPDGSSLTCTQTLADVFPADCAYRVYFEDGRIAQGADFQSIRLRARSQKFPHVCRRRSTVKIILAEHATQYTAFSYPGGERQVRLTGEVVASLKRLAEERMEVDLIARLTGDIQIMDFVLLNNAIRGVDHRLRVHCWLPYLPYARADRRFTDGDCFGLHAFASILNSQDFASVITWDAHSAVGKELIKGLLDQSVDTFIQHAVVDFWRKCGEPRDFNILFPDEGARKRYKIPHGGFGCNTAIVDPKILHASKKRNTETGKFEGFEVPDITTPTIIIDDICDGGGTFIGIAEAVAQHGRPLLGLYVTHGIFSRGFPAVAKHFDHVFCTDTFQTSYPKPGPIVFPVNIPGRFA